MPANVDKPDTLNTLYISRWERGQAVLRPRCNLARLSVTLPNLGFAHVTYTGDKWYLSTMRVVLG